MIIVVKGYSVLFMIYIFDFFFYFVWFVYRGLLIFMFSLIMGNVFNKDLGGKI